MEDELWWQRAKMEKRGKDYPALTVTDKADLDESGLKYSLLYEKRSTVALTQRWPDVHAIAL